MKLSSYELKANVDHTISGQGTGISTLDHSATTPWPNFVLRIIQTNNIDKCYAPYVEI